MTRQATHLKPGARCAAHLDAALERVRAHVARVAQERMVQQRQRRERVAGAQPAGAAAGGQRQGSALRGGADAACDMRLRD